MIFYTLGLDPGLASTGYALLEGDTDTNDIRLVDDAYGIIHTKKWIDKSIKLELPERDRIDAIGRDITKLVADLEPHAIAAEDFVYQGNKGHTTSSMPVLVESIRMLGKGLGYDVAIYANNYWKSALLRNHNASKEQVEHYVHHALNLDPALWNKRDPRTHMRDAMAIGLTFWRIKQHMANAPTKKQAPVKTMPMHWK